MYIPSNRRIADNGTQLTFTEEATGLKMVLQILFVSVDMGSGKPTKGVRIKTVAPLPAGVQLLDCAGQPIMPNTDDHLVVKGLTECSVTCGDNNYGLFAVELVDDGQDSSPLNKAGGVLYFHSRDVIPPELGGSGLLRDQPNRFLE